MIDEKANGDLVFSDFVSGLKVYKQADTPLDLDDEQLKEIFCGTPNQKLSIRNYSFKYIDGMIALMGKNRFLITVIKCPC